MNLVQIIGRIVRDPDIKYSQGDKPTAIASYSIAVDRPYKGKDGSKETDFINCKCFGKTAEFVEKYLTKGLKIAITGSIQTGSYTNKEGQKVYTTDVVVATHEFCESRNNSSNGNAPANNGKINDGFCDIPSSLAEELPFS